ncbi:MAG: Dabb family protein [Acidobacteria bacterium]|nr:Dabb family protein [Acidobacteriota bacterium]
MMKSKVRMAGWVIAAASLFGAGYAAGGNQFGMPKTVISVSLIKWKEGVSETDKIKVIKGVKKMAMEIPGIKNIWITPLRMQPRDFHTAFVIEFADKEAAIRYAEHPIHEWWMKTYVPIRETSISPQITNE